MSIFNSAVLTKKGNELLVTAAAGRKIIFTRLVAGRGVYTEEEKQRSVLEEKTQLKQQMQQFAFSKFEKASENSVLLTALITNKELSEGYKITEIGVYGKEVGDEEDFLCSIAVTRSMDETDSFPPYNGLRECQIIQDYYITISADADVTVNTKGAVALAEDLEALRQEVTIALEERVNIVVAYENISVSERKPNTFYLVVTGTGGETGNETIKASPNMGLKIVERGN